MKVEQMEISAAKRVAIARNQERPGTEVYIDALITDFYELHGDRSYGDDLSIIGGIGYFNEKPVTVIGNRKGKNLEENLKYNFGMPSPEGYRKALRLMKQAEKYNRSIITFINTPGAHPGMEAEERGQGEAIARNLMEMAGLKVPVIAVVIGEGGSGGALALSVANKIIMMENAVLSILSPEGFASILWKDSSRSEEACEIMKLTAKDLFEYNIADYVIKEPVNGIRDNNTQVFTNLSKVINKELLLLQKLNPQGIVSNRYKKFREIGSSPQST